MLLRGWRYNELLWRRLLLEACVAPGRFPVELVCSAGAQRESRYSLLCKDNISCNNIYLIKTLVFCIHILDVCMTTWSWAYIRWASGFGLKTGCDTERATTLLYVRSVLYCWSGITTLPPDYYKSSLLVVLKPNRLIHKRMDAKCSSFHLRVFLGLSNPQGQRQTSILSVLHDNLRKQK
jgi:hypothetical protein